MTTIPVNLEIRVVAPEQAPLLQARPREGGRACCEHGWNLFVGSLAVVSSACAIVGVLSLSWTKQEKKDRAVSAVIWIGSLSAVFFVGNVAISYYKGWFSPASPAASSTAASSTAGSSTAENQNIIRAL